MKNSLVLSCCFAAALASFSASSVTARDFISPNVPAQAGVARAKSSAVAAAGLQTVTNDNDSGPGSLRHAISNAAAGDRIEFAIHSPGVFGLPLPTVILLKSKLVIDKDLTIAGPGPLRLIVARSFAKHTPSFSVFQIDSGVVTISGLTVANGRALNPDGQSDNLGGGILNFDTLTVSNCIVTHNEARTEAGGVGFGGGIFSAGPLTLLNSTISDNEVSGAGGGVSLFVSSRFIAEGCTFSDNFAEVQGGGVNFQAELGHIKNCTISGNEAGDDGAASGLLHLVFPGQISGLDISACTIARNKGDTNGAVVVAALPGSIGLVTRMINTLVANNKPRNFAAVGAAIQSLGHNLDSDGSSGFTNGVNGDIVGTTTNVIDARLGSLSFQGGPTLTHALRFGSPAVDAGVCSDTEGVALTTDQRGFPRPQGLACDIGAFENQPPTVLCPVAGTNECNASLTAIVSDPDGDPLSLVWTVDGADVQTNSVSDLSPGELEKVKLKTSLAVGAHTIGVRVSDGKAAVVSCSSSITVRDTKGPKIESIKASPRSLSPVNNKLIPVTLTVRATDCSSFQCRIVSVRSNEAEGSDADWEITGDLTLKLRAQLSGKRERVYTITVECTDSLGNTSRDTVKVTVSKDRHDDDDDDHDDHDDDNHHGDRDHDDD